MNNFIHLNVHSHYSKGWGIPALKDLCRSAVEAGMDGMALTDTNGVYGLIFFIETAREAGIRPIVGSELRNEVDRAVLLVRNMEGYANLCRIISDRHCRQDFNLIMSLRERREGIIIISDDFRLLKTLRRDSIEDLFVEMSPGYGMHQCYSFSRKSGIPPLATNRVYLMTKDQFPLHRILRAVDMNTKLSRLNTEDICREHNAFISARAMIDQFPHAPEAILNTLRVADRCVMDWGFSNVIFPRFDNLDDQKAYERLYQAALEGCRRRYGEITPAVRERVEHEMKIIREKNFAHYFLVVADITKNARRSCGRGSAAASIVSYALGITHVDPIKHNLFFERFLNLGRMDPPDIDVDFAWDEREQIIDYVFSRYGNARTAMVANHNTYGARSALREVAKVFGLTEEEIGRVTGKIGFGWRLKDGWRALKDQPKMRGMELGRPWDEIFHAASQLENHLNHLSVHCGGMVIVPDEIRRYCPVEISASGMQVLQWEKDSVEEAGLVKIDILGNRSLAVIRDTLDLVACNYGRRIDYRDWDPLNDPDTVRIFFQGETFGVFYFESPATRLVLTKVANGLTFEEYLHKDHFQINVVVTSIIRPASNQSIKAWVARLHGGPWTYPHPLLRPVLEETLGIMVFQEQLSQAAIHMAGFDPAEADTLRKVVSKKHKEKKLRDFHARFMQGAEARGVGPKVIDETWQMMMGFDGYSFCKPHSASYTLVAYKSAYLRAHYPAEFMASVISNGGGYYSTLGYLSEARRMGLSILPPDINQSEISYTGKNREIRVGFMQIKECSGEAEEAIVHERTKKGPFSSLDNLLGRLGENIHLQDARVLIKAGCLDSIAGGLPQSALLWQALRFFDTHGSGPAFSLSMFRPEPRLPNFIAESDFPSHPFVKDGRKEIFHYPENVMLKHEVETLGFPLSIHPLDCYKDILNGLGHVKAQALKVHVGRQVTTVGWLVTGKTVQTKDGDPMKFITFEDTTGIYEAVLFPEIYRRFCHMLNGSRPYILKGRVEEDFGAITMTVAWIGFLDGPKGSKRSLPPRSL